MFSRNLPDVHDGCDAGSIGRKILLRGVRFELHRILVSAKMHKLDSPLICSVL